MIIPIDGVVKDYAWGRPGALSHVLQRKVSDGVEAEWWLGAHPLGPSTSMESGVSVATVLAEGGHPPLGFLLKILTPGSPLSLQVHPSTEQAQSGFDREDRAGIPLDDPTRHYKDPSAKPELVVAWGGPFHALAGIAPRDTVLERLRCLEVAGVAPSSLAPWRERLERGVEEAISWLLRGGQEVRALLHQLGLFRTHSEIVQRLWEHYPEDPGIAVALMLNRVTLNPGESLFLDAGQLHAYLEGTAIELMAPSDNVLRGGLTPKNVDVDELLAIADCRSAEPPYLHPIDHGGGWWEWAPPAQAFALHCLEHSAHSRSVSLRGPAIALSLGGESVVREGSTTVTIPPGGAVLAADMRVLEVDSVGHHLWVATAG